MVTKGKSWTRQKQGTEPSLKKGKYGEKVWIQTTYKRKIKGFKITLEAIDKTASSDTRTEKIQKKKNSSNKIECFQQTRKCFFILSPNSKDVWTFWSEQRRVPIAHNDTATLIRAVEIDRQYLPQKSGMNITINDLEECIRTMLNFLVWIEFGKLGWSCFLNCMTEFYSLYMSLLQMSVCLIECLKGRETVGLYNALSAPLKTKTPSMNIPGSEHK